MDTKKAAMAGLLCLVGGFVLGYGAGRVSTGTPLNPLSTGKGGSYQEGYDAARKKIEDARIFPPAQTEASSLGATIKSVGTDSLVVDVLLTQPNPLDEIDAPVERTVTVTKDTKISRLVLKSPEEMQEEIEAFQDADPTDTAPPAAPSGYKLEPIAFSDLKAGDAVTLVADHDILYEASFSVVEIILIAEGAASPSGEQAPTPPAPDADGQTSPSGAPPTGTPPAPDEDSPTSPSGAPPTGTPPAPGP